MDLVLGCLQGGQGSTLIIQLFLRIRKRARNVTILPDYSLRDALLNVTFRRRCAISVCGYRAILYIADRGETIALLCGRAITAGTVPEHIDLNQRSLYVCRLVSF